MGLLKHCPPTTSGQITPDQRPCGSRKDNGFKDPFERRNPAKDDLWRTLDQGPNLSVARSSVSVTPIETETIMTTRRMPTTDELEVLDHCRGDFDDWPRCGCEHPDETCRAIADFRAVFTYSSYADDGSYEDESPCFYCRPCIAEIIGERPRFRRIDLIPIRPR
jgi:hypothetical protein